MARKTTKKKTSRAKTASAEPAARMTLTERAYAEIRNRVITLEFRPGAFLNEALICDTLGIGRTPVHEALHRLHLEGMVQIVPRKGVLIRSESLNDVIALIETRMLIEPPGMALAAERIKPQHLDRLRDLLKRQQLALKQKDRAGYMALDSAFHGEIVGATGNGVLGEVMRMLHQRASRIWHLHVWNDSDLLLTQREHEAIFAALAVGSAVRAQAAAREHLTSLRARIMNAVMTMNAAE